MITRRSVLISSALPLMAAAPVFAQGITLNKNLAIMGRFLGSWEGEGDGQPGHSQVERSYEAVAGGNFITARNVSTYAAQPKNPKGETHTDASWISYDRTAKKIVLRQFHLAETFVNTYAAPLDALAGDTLIFETTAIENIPAGFRARETYTFKGADNFEEKFEISEPGKAFETYSLNRLRRV